MCYNTFNVPVRTIDANGIVTEYEYNADGLVTSVTRKDGVETLASVTVAYDKNRHTNTFTWDGLALIQCGDEHFLNEPHVGGGNPVVSSKGTSFFNDALGTTVGAKKDGKYSAAALSAFGERLDNVDSTSPAIRSLGEGWFTGKPAVAGLGHAFLMRNYRAGLAKWQTADPMGYPENAPKKLRFGGKPRAQRSARRARKGPRWNQLAYCNNGVMGCVDVFGGLKVEFYTGSFASGDHKRTLHNTANIYVDDTQAILGEGGVFEVKCLDISGIGSEITVMASREVENIQVGQYLKTHLIMADRNVLVGIMFMRRS